MASGARRAQSTCRLVLTFAKTSSASTTTHPSRDTWAWTNCFKESPRTSGGHISATT